MDKKETVLEAFLRQNDMDPDSFEQSEEHGRLYGEGLDEGSDARDAKDKYVTELAAGMDEGSNISASLDIPTQINSKDLNQKTESHPNMDGYDHSLEKKRWDKLGGKSKDGGIEMGDVDDLF